MPNPSEHPRVTLESVEAVSPHNKALYDAGKKMLVDSIDVGRDFCKFMTTTALGAIPTYIALLKLVLPKDYVLQSREETIFLVTPIVFLLAAVLFTFALFPRRATLCLDIPDEIEAARQRLIGRRHAFSIVGFSLFCVATAFASWTLVQQLV